MKQIKPMPSASEIHIRNKIFRPCDVDVVVILTVVAFNRVKTHESEQKEIKG